MPSVLCTVIATLVHLPIFLCVKSQSNLATVQQNTTMVTAGEIAAMVSLEEASRELKTASATAVQYIGQRPYWDSAKDLALNESDMWKSQAFLRYYSTWSVKFDTTFKNAIKVLVRAKRGIPSNSEDVVNDPHTTLLPDVDEWTLSQNYSADAEKLSFDLGKLGIEILDVTYKKPTVSAKPMKSREQRALSDDSNASIDSELSTDSTRSKGSREAQEEKENKERAVYDNEIKAYDLWKEQMARLADKKADMVAAAATLVNEIKAATPQEESAGVIIAGVLDLADVMLGHYKNYLATVWDTKDLQRYRKTKLEGKSTKAYCDAKLLLVRTTMTSVGSALAAAVKNLYNVDWHL
jgi:hypothetical protein